MLKSNRFSIATSLFMARTNLSLPFLIWGAMASQNLSKSFLFILPVIGYYFTSIVFSAVWLRLPFQNDNKFALYRFSGKQARVLYLFRAFYVGGLVFTFIPALLINGFITYLQHFFSIENQLVLIIVGFLLLISVQLVRIQNLLQMDKWLFLFVSITFSVTLFYLLTSVQGISVFTNLPNHFTLLPNQSIDWVDVGVFLSVLWWSTKILDGSGYEAQRFFHAKSAKDAIQASIWSTVFSVILFNIVFLIGFLAWPYVSGGLDNEFWVLTALEQILPEIVFWMVLFSLFFLFISTLSALLDVGATYVVDGLMEWKSLNISRKSVQLYLSVLTVILSFYFESMEAVFKYLIGITAGVGPVFLLRWFVKRVNAFTQLVAMIAALCWFAFLDVALSDDFISFIESRFHLSAYSFNVLAATVLTTLSWLPTLFIRDEQQDQKAEEFFSLLFELKVFQRNTFSVKMIAWVILAGFSLLILSYSIPLLILYPGLNSVCIVLLLIAITILISNYLIRKQKTIN